MADVSIKREKTLLLAKTDVDGRGVAVGTNPRVKFSERFRQWFEAYDVGVRKFSPHLASELADVCSDV